MNDDRIGELALVVRRRLPEWKDEDFKCKLRILQLDSFENLASLKEELQGYHSLMCTLGTRTKVGEEEFKKVDFTYPLEFAKLGLECGAIHYGLLTSKGADHKSMFLYMRTKGQVEEECKKLGYP